MENNLNIKELWRKQAVPVTDWYDMLKKIKSFKMNRIKQAINTNIILLLTIIFAIFIWIYFKPQLISTKIGIILSILPMGIALVFNYKLIPLYRKIDDRLTNSEYLNNLLLVRNRESFIQTKVLNLYFILLSLGIGLYMYEYTWTKSLTFGLLAYSIILLWIGFNWFFIRPKIIEKNRRKIENLIEQIKAIKSQIA